MQPLFLPHFHPSFCRSFCSFCAVTAHAGMRQVSPGSASYHPDVWWPANPSRPREP
jgi:hypothetical protein